MKRLVLLLCVAVSAASAHVVSMSNGELRVDGATATYDLRIPVEEMGPEEGAELRLLDSIRFGDSRRISGSCVTEDRTFHCTAKYLFPANAGEFDVECKLASVTTPNHVHIFKATKTTGDAEQAYFDIALTTARLTFRKPTATELFLKDAAEGFRRGLTGATTVMFLFAIAMVAPDRKKFLTLAAILTAVELATASVPIVRLSPKFLEAASALSVAYLAVEKLLVPGAGQRWLVVAILGIFHGLLLRFFNTESRAGFPAGLLLANIVWLGPAALLRYLPPKPITILLAALGTFWFCYRIWN